MQHHLKDGAAAGGEQLAGQKQFGHPALTGAIGQPPLGYQYAPGGEAWVLTEAGSRKARPIETAGHFTLMVERVLPTVPQGAVQRARVSGAADR